MMARNPQAPQILIMKFGGSSLATPAGVHRAVKIIADARSSGARVVTVVSAQGRTTDGLIDLAAELNSAPEGREMDQLLATGEIASAALMAIALQGQGIPAVSLTAAQAGIQAFGPHGNGVVAQIGAARIFDLVSRGYVVVVAGFQGVDPEGDVITLGRGGSDTTAVELAVGLGQGDCHIYTDVDGVYDADPRLVPSAQSLRTVDATVMTEMARAGAKVVHARAAEMAADNNVRLHVKSTFDAGDGTVVSPVAGAMLEDPARILAITADRDAVLVTAHGGPGQRDWTGEIAAALARHSAPVDLIARVGDKTGVHATFVLRRADLAIARAVLDQMAGPAEVKERVAKVSLIGSGPLRHPRLKAAMLTTLAAAGVPTVAPLFTTPLRISAVIPEDRLTAAVAALHRNLVSPVGGSRLQLERQPLSPVSAQSVSA